MRQTVQALIFAILTAAALPSLPAAAGDAVVTEDMIRAEYDRMEAVLNDRGDAMKTIRFLHDRISDDAVFRLTVTNRTAQQEADRPALELNKQDYINTYVQGATFIADYQVEIQTVSFEYGQDQSEAYTKDIMTERGTMAGNRPFVSNTTCRTRHEIRDGKLVETAGECHTDISFEESI